MTTPFCVSCTLEPRGGNTLHKCPVCEERICNDCSTKCDTCGERCCTEDCSSCDEDGDFCQKCRDAWHKEQLAIYGRPPAGWSRHAPTWEDEKEAADVDPREAFRQKMENN